MRIINLIENTQGHTRCACEHGLCFYVETIRHKLLVDTGASGLLMQNAQRLGVDLTKVDTVFLSHGHSDHGGGILPFSKINPDARIYMQASADGAFYSFSTGTERFIGLSEETLQLPQINFLRDESGFKRIDDELSVFWNIKDACPSPGSNAFLKIKKPGETGAFVQDDFRHEQCLVIRQGGRHILFSGCAHHGILNILERFREIYGTDPDAVISGFHMMQKSGYSDADIEQIISTALALKKTDTVFYTGHCTGVQPYEAMRKILGDQIRYIHCGDEVILPEAGRRTGTILPFRPAGDSASRTSPEPEQAANRSAVSDEKAASENAAAAMKPASPAKHKKGSTRMKYHKFFAWATVVCFVMTMVTGYQKK